MPIFQWESKFWVYKCDKGHLEGPGEQWEWQPQGPGQGVAHFFKNVYDTCLHANFSMGIQILRSQGWQIPYRGSRWTMRMATPGTRTGSNSFFSNIHLIHDYMPIFQWDLWYCLFPLCNFEIWILIQKLAYKHISHEYLKKWTTTYPWGCRSHYSPGPSTWLLSPL